MGKRLTKPQLDALRKFEFAKTNHPQIIGVRRDVAWRLVSRGLLTAVGAWSITRAGQDELFAAKDKEGE